MSVGRRVLAPAPRGPVGPSPKPPSFSVLIPAYDAAATVAQAVESALAQSVRAHEVIVVDDGSTDDLMGALRPFDDRIMLLRKAHGGVASAHNAGAAAATGDFVVRLDADDAFDPLRLEAIAELACGRPDLDLITTDMRFVVDGRTMGTFYEHNTFALEHQREAILQGCFVGGAPAVRRSRLREIGGFDETLQTGSDWDCWLRLILDGSRAGLVDEPHYDYVLHAGSLTASGVSTLWDRVRLLEKAASNPALLAAERPVLGRSLRAQRSRAVRAEAKAALFGSGPTDRLGRLALERGVEGRARVLAGLALVAPSLARRLVAPDQPAHVRLANSQS